MSIFSVALVLSAFLCALVAGFLFAYAIVVMPGIKNLRDAQFIRAFQVTDRVIQDNHPIFLCVWVGSAISIMVCAVAGFATLQGLDLLLLILAVAAYLAGVQVLTIVVHLPLNNKLQAYNVEAMSSKELYDARASFESRWNRSNQIRTGIACIVSLLLIVLVFRQ